MSIACVAAKRIFDDQRFHGYFPAVRAFQNGSMLGREARIAFQKCSRLTDCFDILQRKFPVYVWTVVIFVYGGTSDQPTLVCIVTQLFFFPSTFDYLLPIQNISSTNTAMRPARKKLMMHFSSFSMIFGSGLSMSLFKSVLRWEHSTAEPMNVVWGLIYTGEWEICAPPKFMEISRNRIYIFRTTSSFSHVYSCLYTSPRIDRLRNSLQARQKRKKETTTIQKTALRDVPRRCFTKYLPAVTRGVAHVA